MTRRFITAFFIAVWTVAAIANTAPIVSNVSASQRTDGSGIVDIAYRLTDADSDSCKITVLVSDNGGSTWSITPSQSALSGDFGDNIRPGNRSIQWRSKQDLPGDFGENYRVKIVANDKYFYEIPKVSVSVLEVPIEVFNVCHQPGLWSKDIRSYGLPALGDIEIICQISWESFGSERAMQNLFITLLDSNDNIVMRCGYNDSWQYRRAGRIAFIGESIVYSDGYDVLPYSGAATLSLKRKNGEISMFWNSKLLATGLNDYPLYKLSLEFWFYPFECWGVSSFFGELSASIISGFGYSTK